MGAKFEHDDDFLHDSDDDRDPVGALMEMILLEEDESVVSAAYTCAIPRTFSRNVMMALADDKVSESQASELLEAIQEWEFVQDHGDGEFTYRPENRNYLRARLRKDEPEKFDRLNQRAYAYYGALLPQGWETNERVWLGLSIQQSDALRETVYHLLQYDAERGFLLFRRMFERAVRLHLVEEMVSLIRFLKYANIDGLSAEQRLELSYFEGVQNRIDGQIDIAEEKLKSVISQAVSAELRAKALTEAGKLYYGSRKFDLAIDRFIAAQKIWMGLKAALQSAALSNNIGNVYLRNGNFEQAERAFLSAVANLEKLNATTELGQALNSLGTLYGRQREWEKARASYERSLFLKMSMGDLFGAALTRLNLGRVYQQMVESTQSSRQEKEYRRQAEGILNQCLGTFRQFGSRSNQASTLYSLSLVLHDDGRHAEAGAKLSEAIQIYSALGMSAQLNIARKIASQWGIVQ